MDNFSNKKDNILQTDFQKFNPKELEAFSLEDVLILMQKALKDDIGIAKANLEGCGKRDSYTEEFEQMIQYAEIMLMHVEFVLVVNDCKSQEEISALKEQFSAIKSNYERLESREDLTPVPVKHVAAIMIKVIIFEMRRLMKTCFTRSYNGNIDIVRTEENFAWIKVLTARFKLFDNHFPLVVTFPRDDIFCYERSSPIWQDLYKSAIIKDTYSEQEVHSSFHLLFSRVNIVRILYQNHKNYHDKSYLKTAYSHLKDILYYSVQPAKAEAQARLHLVDPQVEDAFKPWKIAEHPFICFYMNLRSPSISQDDVIYIPRLFPSITADLLRKEYQDKTLNKVCPMDPALLVGPDLSKKRNEVLRDLFVEREDRIPVRILGPEDLNLQEESQGIWKRIMQKTVGTTRSMRDSQPAQGEEAIVIHMHGGGFVALNSNTQKVYLSRWVKNLKLVHFSIDYRLAPKNMYPDALDDVWQAYLWIINYAKTVLGIEHQKVIIAGDSAGGTLALTLSLRLIHAGLKPPHGIVLMYPALSLNDNAFSPSYFLSLNDAMLPVSIIKLIVKAYIGKDFNSSEDPYLSPIVASDELLAKLPPVRIIAGSKDPLNDDNWRLVSKLKKLGKNVKFVLYENLPHGYLSHQDLKDFDIFVQETCNEVQELLNLEV